MRKHLLFLLLVCALFRAPASPDESPGVQTEPPNVRTESPHFNASLCGACHGRDLPEEAEACGGYDVLYNGQCTGCHEKPHLTCRFHNGIRSNKETVSGSISSENKPLSCLSCHEARIQCVGGNDPAARQNPEFLRGLVDGGKERFCFACHETAPFKAFEVHKFDPVAAYAGTAKLDTAILGSGKHDTKKQGVTNSARGRCLYCHASRPGSGRHALRTDIESTCRVCHERTSMVCGRHQGVPMTALPGLIDGSGREPADLSSQTGPMDNAKTELPAMEAVLELLPLGTGKTIQCATCHDPHQNQDLGRSLLRVPEADLLCALCHRNRNDEKVSE